ncbi:hypothetical protein ACMHYP_22870 [Bacillus cereus]|uniref:hypothetical protein n=1 Tax=Bacillus cereus group TaxID=86661 RepID=UPI0015D2B3FD|nr:hypothetical protein [Bacillus sp. AR18-7]
MDHLKRFMTSQEIIKFNTLRAKIDNADFSWEIDKYEREINQLLDVVEERLKKRMSA